MAADDVSTSKEWTFFLGDEEIYSLDVNLARVKIRGEGELQI